jgi:hypothetical protein
MSKASFGGDKQIGDPLASLKKFLEGSKRPPAVALEEDRLNHDKSDLITKLREADRFTQNGSYKGAGKLKTETIVANDLAQELHVQLETLRSQLISWKGNDLSSDDQILKLLNADGLNNVELSTSEKERVSKCLKETLGVFEVLTTGYSVTLSDKQTEKVQELAATLNEIEGSLLSEKWLSESLVDMTAILQSLI